VLLSIRSLLAISCLTLGQCAVAATVETPHCMAAPGSTAAALARLESETRANDDLYHRLTARQGEPLRCSGSAARQQAEGASWLEFVWADQTRFKQSWMQPETFIAEYTNPRGLAHADEAIAAFHDDANRIGMHVDWKAPHETRENNTRVVEYRDPDLNGFVRLTYDEQQRLLAIWLSLAL
jgi:hypothetical protein